MGAQEGRELKGAKASKLPARMGDVTFLFLFLNFYHQWRWEEGAPDPILYEIKMNATSDLPRGATGSPSSLQSRRLWFGKKSKPFNAACGASHHMSLILRCNKYFRTVNDRWRLGEKKKTYWRISNTIERELAVAYHGPTAVRSRT